MNHFFRINLILVLCLLTASSSFAQATTKPSDAPQTALKTEDKVANPFNPPPYQNLRYDEDYSYLRDESKRVDFLDKIKFIPLNKSKSSYLSLGGEVRLRYEYYRNANFGAGVQDKNGYFLGRFMLHGDFHFGKRLRIFGQLKSGLENDRKGGARPFDEDRFDVNQAFADITIFKTENSSLTIRAGRQEVEFGSSRLLSAREGLNVRQSFDGVRVIYKIRNWQFSPSFIKPVKTKFGYFDDSTDSSQTLASVYALRSLPKKWNGLGVVYYNYFDTKRNRFDQGVGREQRQTFGLRVAGRRKAFDFNYELIGQFGKFANARIRAWAIATDSGYSFTKVLFKPRFALRADATSGDRNRQDNRLETFNPIFNAGNAYSGLVGSIGASNSIGLVPSFNLTLSKRIGIRGDLAFFYRTSKRDAVYGLAGGVLRTGQTSAARFVGNQLSLHTDYRFNRHLVLTAQYAHFFIGQFLRESPPSKDLDYFTSFLTYKF